MHILIVHLLICKSYRFCQPGYICTVSDKETPVGSFLFLLHSIDIAGFLIDTQVYGLGRIEADRQHIIVLAQLEIHSINEL